MILIKGCPTCGVVMNLRDGPYGKYFYCPMSKLCGQKLISLKKGKDQVIWVNDTKAYPKDKKSLYQV